MREMFRGTSLSAGDAGMNAPARSRAEARRGGHDLLQLRIGLEGGHALREEPSLFKDGMPYSDNLVLAGVPGYSIAAQRGICLSERSDHHPTSSNQYPLFVITSHKRGCELVCRQPIAVHDAVHIMPATCCRRDVGYFGGIEMHFAKNLSGLGISILDFAACL